MKVASIALVMIAFAPRTLAQSIFDDAPPSELEQWKLSIARQVRDHSPRHLNLDTGRATVRFCVDPAGRVVREVLDGSAVDARGLIALSVISSLKLPPQPPSVRAKTKGNCFWLRQSFYWG